VVKRLNGEDITTISPTLGFNIKTMTYDRRAQRLPCARVPCALLSCGAAALRGAGLACLSKRC
jgi:hypothetical protein